MKTNPNLFGLSSERPFPQTCYHPCGLETFWDPLQGLHVTLHSARFYTEGQSGLHCTEWARLHLGCVAGYENSQVLTFQTLLL